MTAARPKTTGRFGSREELEAAVWREYLHTPRTQADIARAFQVSASTVQKILSQPQPADPAGQQ